MNDSPWGRGISFLHFSREPGCGFGYGMPVALLITTSKSACARFPGAWLRGLAVWILGLLVSASTFAAEDVAKPSAIVRQTNVVEGWSVRIDERLLREEAAATAKALELLRVQLREIVDKVPAPAVARLREIPLYFSPPYPGVGPRAEYHPGAEWLRANHRDPAMVHGVEFTDIRDFESETRRMPNFTLHELAHGYHDRFLPGGFDNDEIKAAYAKAKAGGTYDRVERVDAKGRVSRDRAYAMTNPMEYFAESTEAYFSRNDFFPFNRAELHQHDPAMETLLTKLWGVGP